jgi:hypothetical protein
MTRTRIFVSSTFFDLAQIRDDLRVTIASIGHEALLSEYPQFPILPTIDTIENCRQVVRSSDVFVLIVGGRSGSLDPVSGKTITAIEYETAVQNGIDCFIFVQENVMTLLAAWRKNPGADFSPAVDSSRVFEFVDRVKTAQRWIFTFRSASDISEILKNQLSVFLKDLLNRRKFGRLNLLTEFAGESERARQLVQDRPRLWEYLLTAELLRSKLSAIEREYDDFNRGLMFRAGKMVKPSELGNWLGSAFDTPVKLIHIIKVTMEEDIPAACGKPGEAGNPSEILRSVNRIFDVCRMLLDWELELGSLDVPKNLQKLMNSLHGATSGIIQELKRLPEEISKALEGEWTGTRCGDQAQFHRTTAISNIQC